jgi:hypothetical protein
MSLTINRDQFGKPVLKIITAIKDVSALNNLADTQPAGRKEIAFQSVTIGDVIVDNTLPGKLNLTSSITAGVADASKALVLDNNRNVSGINKIYVDSIYINGILLNPNIFKGSAVAVSANDSVRSELINVDKGIAKADKALILNSEGKISNLNTISVEAVENGNRILVNRFNNNIKMNNIEYFDRFYNPTCAPYFENIFTNLSNIGFTGDFTNGQNYILENCYSNSLELHIAIFSNDNICYSKDGNTWMMTGVTSARYVNWFPSLSLFLAVGSNNLYTSSNGLNWTTKKITNFDLYCIEWSDDLSLFVVGGNSRIAYTDDLNSDWTYSEFRQDSIRKVVYIESSKRFLARGDNSLKSLYYSTDGKKWISQNIINSGYGNIRDIFYCKSKNIIIMPGGQAPDGRTYRNGLYSKDGGFTFKPYYSSNGSYGNFVKIVYIADYSLFIGITNEGSYLSNIAYSADGINWKGFKIYESSLSAGIVSAVVYNKKSGHVFIRTKNNSFSNSQNFKANIIPLNNTIKSYGWGTAIDKLKIGSSDNKLLNIGSESGKIIKFIHNTYSNRNITLNNGELKLSSNSINIAVNAISINNGRVINISNLIRLNNLMNNSYYNLNYSNTDARKKWNYIPKSNNAGNLTISGVLKVKSLLVNGSLFNTSNNIDEFKGIKIGTATADRFIISKYGNELNGLNKVSCNNVKIDNYTISSNNNQIVNLDKKHGLDINEKPVNYMPHAFYASGQQIQTLNNFMGVAVSTSDVIFYVKEFSTIIMGRSNTSVVFSSIDSNNWKSGVSFTNTNLFGVNLIINKCEYIKELNTLYMATTNGLYMSKDMYTWKLCNIVNDINANIADFTYSSQLDTMLIVSSAKLQMSKNGIDFRTVSDLALLQRLSCVKWIDSWGLFIGVADISNSGIKQFVYSYNGHAWNFKENQEETLIKSASIPSAIVYSSKLDMAIAATGNSIRYTYDGKIWRTITATPSSFSGNLEWVEELELFIGNSSSANFILHYSHDGIKWFSVATTLTNTLNRKWTYIHKIGALVNTTNTGTANCCILNSEFIRKNNLNSNFAVNEDNSTISIDTKNNRVGLGLSDGTPQFSLQLGEDLAFKPTSTTWATSSDERLKEDIETADIQKCWDSVKNIPLKKFKWKDNVYGKGKVNNMNQIGWIAQDVENIIPKAVERKKMHGFDDCRTLNNDQIIANMYGAIKKLIDMDEELDSFYEN